MNTWEQSSFTAIEINNRINDSTFEIPKWQRGVVWSDKQREQFVDTLKRGFPFGTILLYYDSEKNQHQIIDGLQRCTTIFNFVNQPARYFNEDDINDDLPRSLAKITEVVNSSSIINDIKNHLIDWVHNAFETMDDVRDMQYMDYAIAFSAQYPSAKGHETEVVQLVKPTLKSFKDLCENLCNVRIPAIIIKGDDSSLPEIFERINSKGTQLSKYEIYAATWKKEYILDSVNLQDLVKYNKERYESIISDGTEIADFDAPTYMKAKKLNLFEIAYAFGKKLGNSYPSLFEIKEEINGVDSLGFSLITACVGSKNAQSKKLHIIFDQVVGTKNVNLFLERIIQCVDTAQKLIGKYNKFKVNAAGEVGPLHTEFQIISLVANIFIARYASYEKDDNDNQINFKLSLQNSNQSWENYEKQLKKNAWKRYCLDVINQRWKGSGDKKLDSIIFDTDYYTQAISWNDFEASLIQWHSTLKLDKREYKRVAPPKESEKIFLAMLYLPIFTAEDQIDQSKYDVEHLATKNLMKKCLDRYEGKLRLPIGSIGNLCLLPQKENRAKKDKTIYDDEAFLKSSKYKLSQLEEKFTFTVKTDLEWLKDNSLDKDQFEQKYFKYIDSRFNKMIDKIKENYL